MSNHHTIMTNNGKALFAIAAASNESINITHLAVGDSNNVNITPTATQTKLVHERHRIAVNSVERHPTNANWIEINAIIPSDSGGYTVREIGLYADSTLIAVGSFPATYKPAQDDGVTREMSIRIIIATENASVVNVAMDSSLVYVTKKWVDDNFVGYAEVVDNLTSTDVDKPLSANMGKKLGDDKADKSVEIIAGNGLTGGGSLSSDANIALGTPSKITATSTNTVSANTHSHEIDKASDSVAGIVQLSHKTNGTDKTLAVSEYALGQAVNALQAQAESRVVTWDNLSNKPSQFAPTSHKHRMDEILGLVNALNKKLDVGSSAPSAYKLARAVRINGIEFDGTQNITITDNTKAPLSHRHTWNEIDGKPAVITNPTQITRGDLDNYKEIGFYYCEADADARGIANTPSNRAFALEVVRAAGVVQIFHEYGTAIVYMRAFYRRWSPWKRLATTEDNAPTARTLAITGDGTGQASFDGSANTNIALTLANSGLTAGSYNSVTVDAKGRVTAGLTQTHGLVTATTATGTANRATGNSNTFLNIVASGVGQTASVGSSTQITGTNGITVSSDAAGKLIVARDSNSPTATKLQTPRTINGVAFDGTRDITIPFNFNVQSLRSDNGYLKFPDGTIIQWVSKNVRLHNLDSLEHTYTMPVQFPNKVVSTNAFVAKPNISASSYIADIVWTQHNWILKCIFKKVINTSTTTDDYTLFILAIGY